MDEKLREMVKELKESEGISYKKMAEKAGITYNTFKKFTSGIRGLSQENQDKLTTYLRKFQE